jgi:hypothetical protein
VDTVHRTISSAGGSLTDRANAFVPVLELAGRWEKFAYLRLSSRFVLGLATIAASFAAFLGWCFGAQRKLLRCTCDSTHVGRSLASRDLLVGLVLAWPVGRPHAEKTIRNYVDCRCSGGLLDRVPWRSGFTRGRPSD